MNQLGVSDKRFAYYKKYYPYRMETLERDDYTCRSCGKKAPATILHVHHVDKKGMNNKYRDETVDNSLSNLITLCAYCHGQVHQLSIRPDKYVMYELRKQGLTFEEIGKGFKISRQRVHQILCGRYGKNKSGSKFFIPPIRVLDE